MSVEPIYYSIDETMCRHELQSLSRGMIDEPASYGPDCAVTSIENAAQKPLTNAVLFKEDLKIASYIIIWIMFVLLLVISVFKV